MCFELRGSPFTPTGAYLAHSRKTGLTAPFLHLRAKFSSLICHKLPARILILMNSSCEVPLLIPHPHPTAPSLLPGSPAHAAAGSPTPLRNETLTRPSRGSSDPSPSQWHPGPVAFEPRGAASGGGSGPGSGRRHGGWEKSFSSSCHTREVAPAPSLVSSS